MIAGSQRQLNAIREFLLTSFSASELDELLYFADSTGLKKAGNAYAPQDDLPAKVRKIIAYCERSELLGELRAEIERARPGQFAPATERGFAAAAVVLALPADLADFTGREEEIERILEHLKGRGAVAISGIHGMGGIGKTALAVHVAHRLIAEGRFKDARLYIDLKGTNPAPVDPADALSSLLNTVAGADPNRPRDVDALAALWRAVIEGKDAVLILDNAAGAAQVNPLLPGCATCAVLATSRRRFTLPGATRLDLDPMPEQEARALLQELALRLEDAQADAVAELCGRLPLALRVAGNYLGLNEDVAPEQYAGMLAEETRLARLRDPDDPDLDVAAAISLSVAQLDPELRKAWALLSLFPAPFDLSAAAALWDEADEGRVLERLQALRNGSLANYDREAERYFQHDLVRLAAAADLGPPPQRHPPPALAGREGRGEGEREREIRGEVEAACLRLARNYVDVCWTADRLYKSGGEKVVQALALFDREWPHIKAGQAWAAANAKDNLEAARLCSAYPDAGYVYLDLRQHPREQLAWLEAAAWAARRLGDKRAEGNHLGNLGWAYAKLGQAEKAIEQYTAALEIARQVGDRRNEGVHLGSLGLAHADLGQVEEAIEQYTAALAIAREMGDRRKEGSWLGDLGLAYAALGQAEKAIEHHQQALDIAREIGDRRREGNHLGNLGVAYHLLLRVEKAIEHHAAALNIAREIGDRRGEGNRLGNLGLAYAALGQVEKAIEHHTAALAISREVSDRRMEGNALRNMGNAYFGQGQVEEAIEQYTEALTIACEIGDRRGEGNLLANLGLTYRDQGDTIRAREHLTQALAIFETIQDRNAVRVRGWLADLT